MEALREELMREGSRWGSFSFAGMLNSISRSSMGKGTVRMRSLILITCFYTSCVAAQQMAQS